ncbi:hypothetical protein SH528x_004296 [Novipirellula sp. SH528]|uniref:hypothetical protein n=1 Tax=Novipirellula sp. SH528 TaxID=3454466 RepID=UPI003F9FCDE6
MRAIAPDNKMKVDVYGQDKADDGLNVALNFMSDQLATPDFLNSLDHDFGSLVQLVVPDFADACKIDLFDNSGGIRRFAKYACDDLLFETVHATEHVRAHRPLRMKIALSDGISFLGTIEFQRLPSQQTFTMDEHLDAKVLASRISRRIVGIPQAR